MALGGNQRILVTGANGYLGSRLCNSLGEGWEVFAVVRSGSELTRLEGGAISLHMLYADEGDFFSEVLQIQPEVVIHTATDYGGQDTRAKEVEWANLEWPRRLLEVFIKGGGSVFVNCDTSLPPAVNHYAFTKRAFRERLKIEGEAVQVINLVMEHFFGPGDGRFVSFVVDQLRAGAHPLSLTAGEQRRDFLYVDDVVNAILMVLEKRREVGPGYVEVGVGSGEARPLRERVEGIADLLGVSRDVLEFGALPYRDNEPMCSVADVSILKGLGWSPANGFEEGILKMLRVSEGGSP